MTSKTGDNTDRPTAKQFFDPLVKVLGRMTQYQPGAGVPYKDVLNEVLREVGIDPSNTFWELRGSNPLGLYRVIGFAYRNQRPNINSSRYSGKRDAYCLDLGRGIWGLSQEGVERSKSLVGTEFERLIHPSEVQQEEELAEDLNLPPLDISGDSRDDITWVTLELSRVGEVRVEEGTLERVLRRDLRVDEDFPIFIPAMTYHRGERTTTVQLMEGYVFVAAGLPEVNYFALERTPYINQVMSGTGSNGIRVLHTIPHQSIREMRVRLRGMSMIDVSPGDRVTVVEGIYEGLVMTVLYVDGDDVGLQTVDLRSLNIITCLPRIFLALEGTETDTWSEE